ncbi:MAG TPA: tetratricopeptide repeat protein [Caulobacteraceae bacterium]|nr:tetratricopeptide repeat protein [Caulobacteraceae bacterium]
MCPKLAILATALTLTSALALASAPAVAAPRRAPAIATAAARPDAQTATASVKATPQERAEADRLDPLARATFWAKQFDIDPRDAEAGVKLAAALRELGRYDQAQSAAEQVLVVQPDNLDALLESARARVAQGQGFYAIEPARRAEALAPRDWRPVALLAVALEQSDRDDEALAAHLKALSLAPDNAATLSNLGLFYATHGEPARAEPLLRQAASAPGATAQERQNLALVLGMEGRFDAAERLERQDLPPDVVASNLAYLRAAAAPAPTRSWASVEAAR